MCNCAAYGGDCGICRGDRSATGVVEGKSGLPALDASKFRPSGAVIVEAVFGLMFLYLVILGVLV